MSKKAAEVAGRKIFLSNLEKNLYPAYGFTKAHVLDYYSRAGRFILPYLKDRALTLKRYPEGVDRDYFFEKRCPVHRPSWVPTAKVFHGDDPMTVCLVNNLDTLIWVGNLASLELHVPLARVSSPETPDSMVFDLDPGDGADILDCARVAMMLRDMLSGLELSGCVKTSGKKGLHVYVPLNRKGITFEDTKKFTKAAAKVLEKSSPDLVTSAMAKELRKNKVFINWSQNDSSKTMICVYSLRAGERPTVSFPLSWEELEELTKAGSPGSFEVLHSEALTRLERQGDLFRDVMSMEQKLPYV